MENKICAFTGHRPKAFPLASMADERCIALKRNAQQKRLSSSLKKRGRVTLITGMALGVDMYAAKMYRI